MRLAEKASWYTYVTIRVAHFLKPAAKSHTHTTEAQLKVRRTQTENTRAPRSLVASAWRPHGH